MRAPFCLDTALGRVVRKGLFEALIIGKSSADTRSRQISLYQDVGPGRQGYLLMQVCLSSPFTYKPCIDLHYSNLSNIFAPSAFETTVG